MSHEASATVRPTNRCLIFVMTIPFLWINEIDPPPAGSGASLADGGGRARVADSICAQRKSRPKAASLAVLVNYCSATGPENAPSVPLARTALFPNVSNAPPPEKLRPVLLPIIV